MLTAFPGYTGKGFFFLAGISTPADIQNAGDDAGWYVIFEFLGIKFFIRKMALRMMSKQKTDIVIQQPIKALKETGEATE